MDKQIAQKLKQMVKEVLNENIYLNHLDYTDRHEVWRKSFSFGSSGGKLVILAAYANYTNGSFGASITTNVISSKGHKSGDIIATEYFKTEKEAIDWLNKSKMK